MGLMKRKTPSILTQRYKWMKHHSASEEYPGLALEISAADRVGLIADITKKISEFDLNVSYIQSWIEFNKGIHILVQIAEEQKNIDPLIKSLEQVPSIQLITKRPTYSRTFGKRIIVMGGGAQVAQVAAGAIAEADRHNIRGETISVDTLALVGENDLAQAVRAVGRLHRAGLLVLAGSLMGGKITEAVKELRSEYGIPVIALKMAGSAPSATDLVVTDPTAAGVMAVMLISHVGKFDLQNIHYQTI